MSAKKITRKELLKSPDEFLTQSERVYLFLRDHTKELTIGLIVCVTAVIIAVGIRMYISSQAQKAVTAYNLAVDKLSPQKFDPAKAEEAARDLERVRENFQGSKPARAALLNLGDIYFKLNKYDQAFQAYQNFLDGLTEEEEIFKPLVLDSLAYVLEAQGKPDQAAARWEQVLNLSGDVLKQEAYLGLGRVYLEAGDKEKSKKAYQDLIEKYPNSQYQELAKAQLENING